MKRKKYIAELNALKETGNYRSFPESAGSGVIDLSSNDYLGLAQDEKLKTEFLKETDLSKQSFSASSSRLLSGNCAQYDQLERLMAAQYQREACLVFNSGYHANAGILPALAKKGDLIIADKLVHASLIDGLQLSKADFLRYHHLDYQHLESIMEKATERYKRIFIVSESIFSMDGDKANLQKLVELKNRYQAFLYLDEAHAVGAVGKNGLGCAEQENLISEIDFLVGTFGKALASLGAFVVCNQLFKDYLVNKARTLIFTTALPPINLAWTKFIMDRLSDFQYKRVALEKLSCEFSKMLGVVSESHIVPFVVGDNQKAIALSGQLKTMGYNVLPIRYPTVSRGTARLRFSLTSTVTIEQLKSLKKISVPGFTGSA